jgi:hypothetical protein
VRFSRWDDGVPPAASIFLIVTLVQGTAAFASHDVALGGFSLLLALGVVLGSRACWIAAFTLSGVVLTLLLIELGFTLLGWPQGWDGATTRMLILQAAQFGTLVALRKDFVPTLAR